jgi:hypothetical protein
LSSRLFVEFPGFSAFGFTQWSQRSQRDATFFRPGLRTEG